MAQSTLEINGKPVEASNDEQVIIFACYHGSESLISKFTVTQLRKAAIQIGLDKSQVDRRPEKTVIAEIKNFIQNN